MPQKTPSPMQALRDLAADPNLLPQEIELVKFISGHFFNYLERDLPPKERAGAVALSIAATCFVAIVNQTEEELTYTQVSNFFQNTALNLHLELTKYLLETLAKDTP